MKIIGRCLRIGLAVGVLTGVASCGRNDRPRTISVEGEVFLDDKPAHRAVVWFHPLEATEPGMPRPRGLVDEHGKFVIGTYKPDDGAPAGRYRVSISWRARVKSGDEEGDSLIPFHYMDPQRSGLPEIEVENSPLTLPAFRLTAR